MSGGNGSSVQRQGTSVSDDQAVQATNDDATSCKRFKTWPRLQNCGLLKLGFVDMQSRRVIGKTAMSISSANPLTAGPQKLAEVSTHNCSTFPCEEFHTAGFYARVTAFRMLVEKFIRRTNKACQVISLGAGFDTLFWYLQSKSLCPTLYLEVDFNSVVARKCHIVRCATKKGES